MRAALVELSSLLALGVTAGALVAGALTATATRRPGLALKVLLDLLLAAGLLRLLGHPGWPAIATAASIVLIRRLIGIGLRAGAHGWSGDPPGGRSGFPRLPDLHRLLRPAWLDRGPESP